MHRIAVISDTHNLLRPEILEIIETCEAIIHAGDISTPDILNRLKELKPLYIVRGNNDRGDWASDLPLVLTFDLFEKNVCMTHIKRNIPQDYEADLIIYGHSHRYSCSKDGNAVFLNPGSCGPRRFNQEITMAVLTLADEDDGFAKEEILAPEMAEGIFVERIVIPNEAHARKGIPVRTSTSYRTVTMEIISRVCEDVDREKTVEEISVRRRIDPELAGQIVRMYLTHQKVTPDEIINKLGL